jgi:hypothetical protein
LPNSSQCGFAGTHSTGGCNGAGIGDSRNSPSDASDTSRTHAQHRRFAARSNDDDDRRRQPQVHPACDPLSPMAPALVLRRAEVPRRSRARLTGCACRTRPIATFHPSAVLRAPDPERKAAMRESVVAALERALAMTRT